MGRDGGALVVVAGSGLAKARDRDLCVLLFGREADIRRELAAAPQVAGDSVIVHTEIAVAATDKPSQAIRRARDSSMGLAIAAVKSGDAQAAVSAGTNGAPMEIGRASCRENGGQDG